MSRTRGDLPTASSVSRRPADGRIRRLRHDLIGAAHVKIEVLPDAESVASKAAAIIADHARRAVAERRRFVFGVSGGKTPWIVLRDLAGENVPWPNVFIVQVDERIAPTGHPDRN